MRTRPLRVLNSVPSLPVRHETNLSRRLRPPAEVLFPITSKKPSQESMLPTPTSPSPLLTSRLHSPENPKQRSIQTTLKRQLSEDVITQLDHGDRGAALRLILDSDMGSPERKKAWLESQIRPLIVQNEPALALKVLTTLLTSPIPSTSPHSNTVFQVFKATLKHNLQVDLETLGMLGVVLSDSVQFIPAHAGPVIAKAFLGNGGLHLLEKVVDGWVKSQAQDPNLITEVTNTVIRSAYGVNDQVTATQWFNLHRRLVNLRSRALDVESSSPGASTSSVPAPMIQHTFKKDSEPYLTMTDGLLAKRPRRPSHTINKMMEQLAEDGLGPTLEIYHLALQTIRTSKQNDKIASIWENLQSSSSLLLSPETISTSKSSSSPTNLLMPDAYTFCLMFTILDDASNRHTHSARPSGIEVFRYMMDVQLYHHLRRQNSLASSSETPERKVITKGALNLALRYFMNSQQYAQALVVLQTFLSQTRNFGFGVVPNARTKWFVDSHILKRCVGELKSQLKAGHAHTSEAEATHHSLTQWLADDEAVLVAKEKSRGSSWAECLLGLKLDTNLIRGQTGKLNLPWSDSRMTAAYSSRSSALNYLTTALTSIRPSKPNALPLPFTFAIDDVTKHLDGDGYLPLPSRKQMGSRVVESWQETEVDCPPINDRAQSSKLTASIVRSSTTASTPLLPPASIQDLLEVVGRCALAAEGIGKDVDENVKRTTLDKIVRDAEDQMFSKEYREWKGAAEEETMKGRGRRTDRLSSHSVAC